MEHREELKGNRSTALRKNGGQSFILEILTEGELNLYVVIGPELLELWNNDAESCFFSIDPNFHYMVINRSNSDLILNYGAIDPSSHEITYEPYKFEHSEKVQVDIDTIKKIYSIPKDYIDTLPKWYSFKFTYKEYNLIFIRPQIGISWQRHELRNEHWEVIKGNPIIIIGNTVHYYVENGTKLDNPKGCLHSIINPNMEQDKWVIIKESWSGEFDEMDIERIFNPNHYY